MLSILLSFLMILTFCVFGLLCFRIFRFDRNLFFNTGFCSFIPVLGAVFLTCIIQLLSLVFPVKVIAPGLLFILICTLYFIKDIGVLWLKTMFENKYLLLIILSSLFILQFPIISKGELLSLQNSNNDIAFYLSSMDWLKSHRITEPIVYSSEVPFNSLANYMITNTRFGTDLLGSFFMCIFQLESHEIFYLFSNTLGTLTIFSCYFLLSYCLDVSKRTSLYTSMIFAAGGLWVFLIFSQYAPQIYGITCLLSFSGLYLVVNPRKKQKGFVFLAALLLVGTLTVYAEYAVYLFFIYVIITLCKIINAETGMKIRVLLESLKVGALSFLLNPVGMFIAARFNVNILKSVMVDSGSIDAYFGRMMPFKQLISNLYGAPDYERLKAAVSSFGMFSRTIQLGYDFLMIILPLLFLTVICVGMFRKKNGDKYAVLGIILFFFMNEIYLRLSSNAYAEMKHITTIAPFVVIFFAYFADGWKLKLKKSYIKKIILSCTLIIVAGMNLMTVYQNYKGSNIYYFDHSAMELRNAANMVPLDEPIGITSSSPADKHAIVYALKDVPIKHNKTSEVDYSYFSFLAPHQFENTKYSVVSMQDYYSFLSNSENVLWHNSKYVLLYAPTIAIRPTDGFYNLEKDGVGYFRWTSSNKSELSLFNATDNEQNLTISLKTEKGIFDNRDIKVYAKEKLIAEGGADTTITTELINLKPRESISVSIISDGKLNTVDTGDNRNFGFILRHLDINMKNK
ncbi:hypothetical protein [Paenibacillus sp. FSL R5-0914]|uniref:hypothetical protein n=1 Tax=Paenibacillus sp. FSL R5-0914 TaxID=2921665 RepID=UPI0030F8943F